MESLKRLEATHCVLADGRIHDSPCPVFRQDHSRHIRDHCIEVDPNAVTSMRFDRQGVDGCIRAQGRPSRKAQL